MNIKDIISFLQRAGLTQLEIANAIGCSQPHVSLMASGKISTVRPSWKVVAGLHAIARKNGLKI